ncbi:MAG: sulfatase [Verrucomicrobiota bacterium]
MFRGWGAFYGAMRGIRQFLLVGFLSGLVWGPVGVRAEEGAIRNVLFLISDDLKASVLGCYGDDVVKTPNLDRLAAEGVVFERAYCQGTSCGPSRQSFMFSRYRGEGEVNLGQHFRENGWYSARVGKIYHMRVPGDIIAGTNGKDVESSWTERFNSPGLEAHTPGDYACLNLNIFTTELEGRESTQMKNRMFVTVSYEGDGSDQPDHKTATKTMELLREHQDEKFFIAAGFVRPHYPMVQPEQYFDLYPWEEIELPEKREGDWDDMPPLAISKSNSESFGIDQYPDNQKRMWAGYYASVTFMDEQVGRILDELDRLGLRESTAIVFTSDHGYHLGEHDFWQKSNLHEEVLRVPLLMSVPGFEPGRTESIVELMDLYPTLSELAGLPVPEGVQGVSLVPVLEDHAAVVREDGALSLNNGYSLRGPRWVYTWYNDGGEELYDMENDPKQFTNEVGNPEYAPVLNERREAMGRVLGRAGLERKGKKKNG